MDPSQAISSNLREKIDLFVDIYHRFSLIYQDIRLKFNSVCLLTMEKMHTKNILTFNHWSRKKKKNKVR